MSAEFDYPEAERYELKPEVRISPLAIAFADRMIKTETDLTHDFAEMTGLPYSGDSTVEGMVLKKTWTALTAQAVIDGNELTPDFQRKLIGQTDFRALSLELSKNSGSVITPVQLEYLTDEIFSNFLEKTLDNSSIWNNKDIPNMFNKADEIAKQNGLFPEEVFKDDDLFRELTRKTLDPDEYVNKVRQLFGIAFDPAFLSNVINMSVDIIAPGIDIGLSEADLAEAKEEFMEEFNEMVVLLKPIFEGLAFKFIERNWGIETAETVLPGVDLDFIKLITQNNLGLDYNAPREQ